MAHGGARPNAGRKKAGVNRLTADAVEHAKATGELPLDFLLRVMRDPNTDEAKQIDCAKAAAPYVHAKLSSVEHSGNADKPLTIQEVRRVIVRPGD